MSKYTKQLSAEQLIHLIGHDYTELSHEKIVVQRDWHMRICREWLEYRYQDDGVRQPSFNDDF
jgi:hypothetical protein